MATDATITPAPSRPRQVFYPERDGKPMGETRRHKEAIVELIEGLGDRLAAEPRTLVTGDQLLYFVEGQPSRVVVPDVFIARGVDPQRSERIYKTWENDGINPELVVEVSSRSTRREDLRRKFVLYRDVLKVREYFVFDPLGEYLRPRLQGFRLDAGDYFAIEPVDGRLPSLVAGVHLVTIRTMVRLFDPATGQIIPTRAEALAASRRSERRKSRTIQAQAQAMHAQERAFQLQEQAIRERDQAIQLQEQAIRERDRAIQLQEQAIQVQEQTFQVQEQAIRERDQALERAEAERAALLAEIARLKAIGRDD